MTPPNSLAPAELVRRAGFPVNPPATEAALQELAAAWGVELPDEVRALYLDHDGQLLPEDPLGPEMPFRLLSVEEAVQLPEDLTLDIPLFDDLPDLQRGILPLWGDIGGNYAVYFLRGARRGMIGELHHEIPWSIAPKWRSLASFYAAMVEAAHALALDKCDDYEEDYEFPTDFPSVEEADERQKEAFAEAQAAFAGAGTAYERDYWSAHMVNLCPLGQVASLAPLLTPEWEEGSYANVHVRQAAERMVSELGKAAMPYVREALADNVNAGLLENNIIEPLLRALAQYPQPETVTLLRDLVEQNKCAEAPYHQLITFSIAKTLVAHGYVEEQVKNEAGQIISLRLNAPDGDVIEMLLL